MLIKLDMGFSCFMSFVIWLFDVPCICLYPRHLCQRVYSFRLSVRPFVCSFVRTSVTFVEFASKFCVKVSQVVYISATTHQKAFIFGP